MGNQSGTFEVAELETVDQLSKMIGELRDLELGPLFEDAELRRVCTDSLKSWGCPSIIARLVVEALAGLVAFCEEGVTTNVSRRLLHIAAGTPLVRKLLDRVIASANRLSDRARLKNELIRNLRGERVEFSGPADYVAELEIVKFLYEKYEREELLAKIDDTIAVPLQNIGAQLDELVLGFYEPILSDPRVEGLESRAQAAESLLARAERDTFQGRKNDLDFLDRFLGDTTARGPLHRFRWALLTGPGGEGKTRLAIKFLRAAEYRLFRAGFLTMGELKKLERDARRWRPRWATLLVIDYPAQLPGAVAEVLHAFAQRAVQPAGGFEFPVRVLLLEREAEGEWFKTVLPADGQGEFVRKFGFYDGPTLAHPISPLSYESLIAIMRGRLPDACCLDDGLLFQTLLRVDPNLHEDKDGWQAAPRPLFAAATAQAIADALAEGNTLDAVISTLRRQEVFSRIIERERRHFWSEGEPPFSPDERHRREIHENLLLLATFALDLPRELFEEDCPEPVRKHLPSAETLDEERYRRMAAGDSGSVFKRLEPDLLGEFFVLDKLKKKDRVTRQSLVDAGLQLGGDGGTLFLIRCALDFPDDWNNLNRLKPSRDIAAMRVFTKAATGLTSLLPNDRINDVAAVVSDAIDLADCHEDAFLREQVAKALINKGGRLGALNRSKEAIAVYDDLLARFGTATELPLREQVTNALFNKGVTLGALNRSEEAIAVYDNLLARFNTTTELPLRERVAIALVNKGGRLGALNRSEEAIAVYDDLLTRFGTATELPLRERVAIARVLRDRLHNF